MFVECNDSAGAEELARNGELLAGAGTATKLVPCDGADSEFLARIDQSEQPTALGTPTRASVNQHVIVNMMGHQKNSSSLLRCAISRVGSVPSNESKRSCNSRRRSARR